MSYGEVGLWVLALEVKNKPPVRCVFSISCLLCGIITPKILIQNFGSNCQVWMYKAILCIAVSYCVSLIIVTLTTHIFIHIFQMEHFLAVKFAIGYEKNISFLVMPKSPKV